MKKWGWKQFSVMGLVLSLAISSTAFAGELNIEGNTEKETKAETRTETETEQEENGLESRFFVMEKNIGGETEAPDDTVQESQKKENVKETTLEELEAAKDIPVSSGELEKEVPQTVFVVFQAENFWSQTAEQETELMTEETQGVETVLDTVQDSEAYGETESGILAEEEELPAVTLTKAQKEQVLEASSFAEDTVVVVNGVTLKDELLFHTQKKVKAVLSMNEKTEEAFKEAVEDLELEQVYADYQKKIEEASVKAGIKTAARVEESLPQTEALLPGNTLSKSSTTSGTTGTQTPSTSGTEESTDTPGSSVQGTSGTTGTTGTTGTGSTSTTTTKKEITLTMVPDLLEEEDDVLYAVYEISCPDDVKISEASFKLTYDSTKMDYDKEYSDAGVDFMDDFTYTGTDNAGSITINMKSKNGTALAAKGEMLDIGFELKEEAKVGDIYNLKLEVTSLKNGSVELTTDSNYNITVKEESIRAVAYTEEEEEQTESQTQTQTETQTQTQTQTQSLQKAAKTDDTTNTVLWMLLMAASAGVYVLFQKKREQAN